MRILMEKTGGIITVLSFVFMVLVVVWIGAMFSISSGRRKYNEGFGKAEQAVFLAEKGIALGYIELKYHGFNWFTHIKNADNTLDENDNIEGDPELSELYVEGAKWDNGDYLPTGEENLRVRTYLDDDNNIWIVARAEVDGVVRVARMRLESGSLYDYFMFVPGDLVVDGNNYFDAQGIGKIYVGGDLICKGNAIFKDVVEFSTGSSGGIRVYTRQKTPPYLFDKNDGSEQDGYTLLRSKKGEFGYKDYRYPADDWMEIKWTLYNPFHIFWFKDYNRPDTWFNYDTPTFVFTREKMEEKISGWENYPPPCTEVLAKVPYALFTDEGQPVKRNFDIYKGDNAVDVNEVPVKFIRLYYKEGDRWRITSDPSKPGVVAQVFDGKETTGTVEYKVNGETYYIPVDESDVVYKWVDENGETHERAFNVEYEKIWWLESNLDDSREYVQNGYSRKDGDPLWDPSHETTWTNLLDTHNTLHCERFADWLAGNYNYEGEDENESHKLDLRNIIKVGQLGGETKDVPEINVSFSSAAKSAGIWIGYEDCGGDHVLTVYVNGEKVYSEGNMGSFPEWLKEEEFYTGNDKQHGTDGIKAKVITLDIKAMQEKLGMTELGNTNGIIWINYRNPDEDVDHQYNKAVRLINGEVLPRSLTIVTPQSVMIQGDFNCKDNSGMPDPSDWKPSAIITDGDVYVLSEHFTPPTDVPSYKLPRFPGDDGYFSYGGNYIKRARLKWLKYLTEKLGDDFWPKWEDDPDVREEKLEKIKDAIKDFYDGLDDKKYGAPDMDKFNINDIDIGNTYSLPKAIISAFYKTHNPLGSSPGYAKAMPVVRNTPDDKHIYIYASIIRSPKGNEVIGPKVYYLENWRWLNEYSGSWDDPPSGAEVVLKGMFPRIESSVEEIAEKDRWSEDYSEYLFASGANHISGAQFEAVGLNPGPVPKYYAQDYNNNYPPGNALVTAVKAYYISSNPEDFDRHPAS